MYVTSHDITHRANALLAAICVKNASAAKAIEYPQLCQKAISHMKKSYRLTGQKAAMPGLKFVQNLKSNDIM
ncbi:hypothetical protein BTJ39_00485 [Izhakiella australiensis]|uniref:Uncharacterized protein n=1 Tax=Izhakiella australiensis TaxID=1926881 RepID=A0A1S8YRB2_9GAMM|nr:hypothetical protein BTJ39_00485 [Izhakiella australiensis]